MCNSISFTFYSFMNEDDIYSFLDLEEEQEQKLEEGEEEEEEEEEEQD